MPQILNRFLVVQLPIPRALLWNHSFGGTPEVEKQHKTNQQQQNNGLLPSHRMTPKSLDGVKTPEIKTRSFPMKSPGSFTTMSDTVSRDKHLRKSLTLALYSYPEEFSSWSVDQSCLTYDPKHKPSLCFQTTVQTALAYTPNRLRPLDPNMMTVLGLSKGIVFAQSNGHIPINRINLQSP